MNIRDLLRLLALMGIVTLLVACGRPSGPADLPAARPRPAAAEPGADRVMLFLGDSLTAGYHLDPADAYPALIQQKLDDAGYVYRVVNAGVSGDTTQDGLQRLDWVLRQPVDIFVLALGANDALRGQPIDHIEGNLDAILSGTRARSPDVQLVLAGMRMPLNYGPAYTRSFERMYRDLARRHDAVLIPFLLDGVAGRPDLNLRDGIHPTEEGQRIIADTVWTYLRPAVR